MRLRQLDALRGLAAMAVMFHHFMWTRVDTQAYTPALPHWFWLSFHLLHPVFAGHEAVLLFFVLSGLVLSPAILRREQLAYPGYVLHRVARIYVPYLGAIVLAIVACYFFRAHVPPWTAWTVRAWPVAPSVPKIVDHLLFLGTYPLDFNVVIWSLIIELRISIVLPFLVYALVWLRLRRGVAVVGLLALGDAFLAPVAEARFSPVFADLYRTAHFSLCFLLGALVSLHAEAIGRVYLRLSAVSRLAIGIGCFVGIGYANAILNKHLPRVDFDLLVGAVGASGLLAIAMHDRWFAQVLGHRVLLWLGDISFSLYLLHLPVILVLSASLHDRLPYPVIAMIGVVTSLALARLFWFLVEVPSRTLGKALDRRYAARATPVPALV